MKLLQVRSKIAEFGPENLAPSFLRRLHKAVLKNLIPEELISLKGDWEFHWHQPSAFAGNKFDYLLRGQSDDLQDFLICDNFIKAID